MKKITLAVFAFVLLIGSGLVSTQTSEAREPRVFRTDVRSSLQINTEAGLTRSIINEERLNPMRSTRTLISRNYQRSVEVNQPTTDVTVVAAPEQTPDTATPPPVTTEAPLPTSPADNIESGETITADDSAAEPATYLEQIASEIHRFTNQERVKAGLNPLQYDQALAALAQSHSLDMATNNYFSHTAEDGCSLTCRLDRAGYKASAWGENIIWVSRSTLPDATTLAQQFVSDWMNSPGHRENILRTSFTHEGVGVAQVGNRVYATADFSRPQ